MIAPFPLLFFGGDISVLMEEGHETVAVDEFIKFKSPTRIANLVKVRIPGGGGGVFDKVLYGERLRPEVQTLTLLYTIFETTGIPFVYLL